MSHTLKLPKLITDVSASLKKSGITINQYVTLCLMEGGPQKMSELAKNMDVTTAAMTGTIDRMEELKLVKRNPSKTDRRIIDVACTAKGTSLMNAMGIEFGHRTT